MSKGEAGQLNTQVQKLTKPVLIDFIWKYKRGMVKYIFLDQI